MKNVLGPNKAFRRSAALESQREQVSERIATLSEAELTLASDFIEQMVKRFDPDIVADFLSWRDDPRIESILQISASLDTESREQLLFEAENLVYDEPRKSGQS